MTDRLKTYIVRPMTFDSAEGRPREHSPAGQPAAP